MNVQNMEGRTGRPVANQFIVKDVKISYKSRTGEKIITPTGAMFQSYESNIAFRCSGGVFLDERYWDYSRTTGKYRNIFLNETKKETEKKIASGEYKLVNLNE